MKPKIYIVAHTEVQLDVFLRKHRIPKPDARRVRDVNDVCGVRPEAPLILLPGWQETRGADEIFAAWHHRGGEVLRITEAQARGEQPLRVGS